MRDSFSVLIVSCPDGNFISFGSDIDHSPAHIIAVVIKGLTDEAQQLLVWHRWMLQSQGCRSTWIIVCVLRGRSVTNSKLLQFPAKSGPGHTSSAACWEWWASGLLFYSSHPPTWARYHPATKAQTSKSFILLMWKDVYHTNQKQ